jgi:thioredoxin-like negative regulator of GroEL
MNDYKLLEITEETFRVSIDSRKVVFFFLDRPSEAKGHAALTAFTNVGKQHPEMAFAHIDVEHHPEIARRVMVEQTPAVQIWIDGDLFTSQENVVDLTEAMLNDWLKKATEKSEHHRLYDPLDQEKTL